MVLSTALWAAVGALAIGTAALWTNVRRPINRAIAATSGFVAGWLICIHFSATGSQSIGWLRAEWIVLGFFPVAWWLARDFILRPDVTLGARLAGVKGWWVFPAAGLALSTATPFVQPFFDGTGFLYRGGYYTSALVAIAGQAAFAFSTIRQLRGLVGARRLELQLLALGGAGGVTLAVSLLACSAALGEPGCARLMPLVFVGLYGGLAWSLLTTRVLDAKHILTLGLEKLALVAGVSVFVWGIQQIGAQFLPEWLSLGLSISLGLWFAAEVRPWLQEISQRKAVAERVRQAAFDIARREVRPEKMEKAFTKLLSDWANCDRVVFLMASQGRLIGGGLDWGLDAPELKLLHNLRWATRERLERERPRVYGRELSNLLEREKLAAVVASGGPSLAFAIGLSTPRTLRPYTYPEIGQLLGLETIIENALSRAHYLMKAQHAEQLATVGLLGASIAHEIRNPLVSIKTFVQLLPHHYQEPAFREKFFRLIGDEVGRIDRLTEQLLDLSSPRVFAVKETAIHLLLSNCVDLIAAKADDKKVQILTEYHAQSDRVYTDPNAVKQVVLNLGFNAIQALETKSGERWIKLSSREVPAGLEVTVTDNGPGISPDVWSRLFQPFQSTKSSGFGLGLAICKDILSSLHASISADPPEPGRGATFRIVLPCQPPTS